MGADHLAWLGHQIQVVDSIRFLKSGVCVCHILRDNVVVVVVVACILGVLYGKGQRILATISEQESQRFQVEISFYFELCIQCDGG